MEYYNQQQLDKLLYFMDENSDRENIINSIEKSDSDMHGSLNIQQKIKSDREYDETKPFNIPCIFGW